MHNVKNTVNQKIWITEDLPLEYDIEYTHVVSKYKSYMINPNLLDLDFTDFYNGLYSIKFTNKETLENFYTGVLNMEDTTSLPVKTYDGEGIIPLGYKNN